MSYTRRSEWRSRIPSAVISRRKSSRGQQGLGAAQSLWLWKEINICSKILFWDMNWGSSHSPTSLTFRCPVTQQLLPTYGAREGGASWCKEHRYYEACPFLKARSRNNRRERQRALRARLSEREKVIMATLIHHLLCTKHRWSLRQPWGAYWCHRHYIVKKTKAQRRELTCPSHIAELQLKPEQSDSEAYTLESDFCFQWSGFKF